MARANGCFNNHCVTNAPSQQRIDNASAVTMRRAAGVQVRDSLITFKSQRLRIADPARQDDSRHRLLMVALGGHFHPRFTWPRMVPNGKVQQRLVGLTSSRASRCSDCKDSSSSVAPYGNSRA